jgi:hypothetical protein
MASMRPGALASVDMEVRVAGATGAGMAMISSSSCLIDKGDRARASFSEPSRRRAEARRSGRSQQEVIRAAINRYLSLTPEADSGQRENELELLIASVGVRRPRTPYRRPRRRVRLPGGVTSADLLDRSDRI